MASDENQLIEVRNSEIYETNIYFDDGVRRIDFVLAYNDSTDDDIKAYRETYLKNLEVAGLQLEAAESTDTNSKDAIVHFVKVHAPIEVLYESAEDMKMKMHTTAYDIDFKEWYEDNAVYGIVDHLNPMKLQHPETNVTPNYFVQPFNKERLSEFVNYDKPDIFFTAAERGRLVSYVLERVQYGDDDVDVGIEHLVFKGAFLDAFPLHDGPVRKSSAYAPTNNRQRLEADWANWRSIFCYQPIEPVKEYLGEKIAFYFAWIGFYTTFLVPAAIVGVICFIYGLVASLHSPLVRETCSDPAGFNNTGHLFFMCPLCDKQCSYFLLNITCKYAKVTCIFDNDSTPYFAAFMAIWSMFFLEFWKRHQVSLAYDWHSIGFEEAEEQVRPEYAVSDTILKRNPVTGLLEPYMPPRKRIARLFGTFSVVTFFITLVVIAVFGVIVFRAVLSVALVASDSLIVRQRSKTIVSVTAGTLNVVVIYILKFVYKKVAVLLTDWENPRTRTDYDDSFTIKMFWFQFFNTYSSIIYIAFLKSESLVGTPGRYRRIGDSKARMEGCSAQGCFFELSIQLIIIMAGNVLGNIFETAVPTTMKWWRDRKAKQNRPLGAGEERRWVDDYRGEMQTTFSVFWGYSEIVLQYGFLTMFVAAFPLAPLFAFLSNLVEIRVDAYNYIHNFRRPIARRAEDIGAWYGILVTITNVSIFINALVIAFTSEFIPRMVYRYTQSPDGSLNGFINWSLSSFDVNDFSNASRTLNPGPIPVQDQCRYPGYYDSSSPYKEKLDYWLILTARLAFVLIFVVIMTSISWAVAYLIPDVPKNVQIKLKREKYLEQKADIVHKEKEGKRKRCDVTRQPINVRKRRVVNMLV